MSRFLGLVPFSWSWTEPDRGYIDGANLYQADGGSPVTNVDPSGMYIARGGRPIMPTHPGQIVPFFLSSVGNDFGAPTEGGGGAGAGGGGDFDTPPDPPASIAALLLNLVRYQYSGINETNVYGGFGISLPFGLANLDVGWSVLYNPDNVPSLRARGSTNEYDSLRDAGYSPGSAAFVMAAERTPPGMIACGWSNLSHGKTFAGNPLSGWGKAGQWANIGIGALGSLAMFGGGGATEAGGGDVLSVAGRPGLAGEIDAIKALPPGTTLTEEQLAALQRNVDLLKNVVQRNKCNTGIVGKVKDLINNDSRFSNLTPEQRQTFLNQIDPSGG